MSLPVTGEIGAPNLGLDNNDEVERIPHARGFRARKPGKRGGMSCTSVPGSRRVTTAVDPVKSSGVKSTVHYAIASNLIIAVAKAIAAVLTGSAALVAETAHSVADTGNQALLRISLSKAERPADEEHPFGYGRERFFWALLVAVMIFLVGALASLAEGVLAILVNAETRFTLAYVVLALAFVTEGVSLARAYVEVRRGADREGWSFNHYVRVSTDPTVRTVLFEDAGAVIGVLIAAGGLLGHQLTGERYWEGIASILIGLLLAVIAFSLGQTSKELLIGRPARESERDAIRAIVANHPEIEQILDLRTVHLGPESLFVALRVALLPDLPASRIEAVFSEVNREITREIADAFAVYLDPSPGCALAPLGRTRLKASSPDSGRRADVEVRSDQLWGSSRV